MEILREPEGDWLQSQEWTGECTAGKRTTGFHWSNWRVSQRHCTRVFFPIDEGCRCEARASFLERAFREKPDIVRQETWDGNRNRCFGRVPDFSLIATFSSRIPSHAIRLASLNVARKFLSSGSRKTRRDRSSDRCGGEEERQRSTRSFTRDVNASSSPRGPVRSCIIGVESRSLRPTMSDCWSFFQIFVCTSLLWRLPMGNIFLYNTC